MNLKQEFKTLLVAIYITIKFCLFLTPLFATMFIGVADGLEEFEKDLLMMTGFIVSVGIMLFAVDEYFKSERKYIKFITGKAKQK